MKTLPLNVSRTVGTAANVLADRVTANGAALMGTTQVDAAGSATLTKLQRTGNDFSFAFEFDQGVFASGSGAGTVQLTALGANTTRVDCRGQIELGGAAAKLPDFILKKRLASEIDKIVSEILADIQGPETGRAVA